MPASLRVHEMLDGNAEGLLLLDEMVSIEHQIDNATQLLL